MDEGSIDAMATVLVVDDERLICELLGRVLTRQGHDVLTATGGTEALKLFQEQRPRVTLLDLRMPDMDGIAVFKQIRAIDPKASVIILTGGGTAEWEKQAYELGVTDFLRKGFPLDALMASLDRATKQPGKAAKAAPRSKGAPAKSEAGESILVVDDEPMIRDLLSQFLTLRGYRVCTAQDGREALDLVSQESPRMIILDMYMPSMNGLEVLRRLRSQQYKGGAVALTASQDEPSLQEMLELGSVDVMGKPVDLERLWLVI